MYKDDESAAREQRRAPRLPIEINFTYTIINPPEDLRAVHHAVTKNISSAGLVFESDNQLPIDTELKLVINIPGLTNKSFDFIGSVARIEKLFPSFKFDIGVSFTKISPEQKEELKNRIDSLDILKLLSKINKREISDLHLTVDSPPMVRSYGKLIPLSERAFSAEEIKQMLYAILSPEQKKHFEAHRDLDFAFSLSSDIRCRVSIFQQRGKIEAVFRNIVPINIEELGLPDIVEELCSLKEGIVIIAGTTGSGKTTTITAMIDIINKRRGAVILSLEKPIEYIHKNVKGIVKQREIGVDVSSFGTGLKAALRQDPDVVVVGEVLDMDTLEATLQAAETGHLVVTSLHATDSVQVFDRIISFFPPEQRVFIYARLSHSLKAIIVQNLLLRSDGFGRILATEVCLVNTAVRRIIASGNLTELPSVIQTGRQYKMHLIQDSVEQLFNQGLIGGETYEVYAKKTVATKQ